MCPWSSPGKSHAPALLILRANRAGHGTVRTCPPLPFTLSVHPLPTGSTSRACTHAHSARRSPHTAMISIASLTSLGAACSASAISASGIGRGVARGIAIAGSLAAGLVSSRPSSTHHEKNARSDARADLLADGPISREASHRTRSLGSIDAIGLSANCRQRLTCEALRLIVPRALPPAT